MNNVDQIAAEAVAQLNTIDGTERRHAIAVVKSAIEKAWDADATPDTSTAGTGAHLFTFNRGSEGRVTE